MRRPSQEGREGSVGPTGGPGGIKRPSQTAKRGRESPQEGWMDREAFQKGRRILRPPRSARRGWEGSRGPSGEAGRDGKGWESILEGR